LLVVVCAPALRAGSQAAGVHPHIAPVNGGVPPTHSQPASDMPMLNFSDGVWNMGEGFRLGADEDHGGWASPDDAALEPGDIRQVSGWQPFAGPPTSTKPLQRFVGHLWPAALSGQTVPVTAAESSFEVFAPQQFDPARPVLVVVVAWSTQGGPPASFGGRFAYPGVRPADGLVPLDWSDLTPPVDDIRRPGPDPILIHDHVPAGGPQLITIYMVTRTFGRPLTFACQRSVQAARVVDLMLSTPGSDPSHGFLHPPGFPVYGTPVEVARMIAGASFGGLTAQVLLQTHPDVFHGAFVGSFSSSLRQVMGEQFSYEYICRRTGTAARATALELADSLEWPFALRQRGFDYFNTSTTLRLRRGELRGPVHFLIGDEDTVATGTDFLPLLSGVRDYREQFRDTASHHGFTVVDRRDHQAGLFETPYSPNAPSFAIERPAAEMAADVVSALPQTWVAPTILADDGSEDPYDEYLDVGLHIPYAPSPNDLLEFDTAFGHAGRSDGQGLTLGLDESLRVHDVPVTGSDPVRSIFVGSAEGVVTRFVPVTVDPSLPPELHVAASSASLGYGAWALAVGEVDSAHAGEEVVVGVYRDVYVLDALTLSTVRSVALGFEHTRPRRMQIAEVFPSLPGEEIVFVTFHGHLVVMDAQLQVVCDLGEPGIQDFVVHKGAEYAWADPVSKVPISILSHRGCVANITLKLQTDPTLQQSADLHCWTTGMLGVGNDLELFRQGGSTWLAVATAVEQGYPHIHVFHPLTLQPPGVGGPPPTYTPDWQKVWFQPGFMIDIAPIEENDELLGFVFSQPGRIGWVDVVGSLQADFTLWPDTFGPATGPVAIAVGDLFPRVPGFGTESHPAEVVVSTNAGHVVAMHLDDVLASGGNPGPVKPLSLPASNRPAGSVLPYTNRTLAGTWGMTVLDAGSPQQNRLVVAHQAAGLFDVDPTSAGWALRSDVLCPKFNHVTGQLGESVLSVTPVRDLAHVGAGIGSGSAPERIVFTGSSPVPWWTLTTKPWLNGLGAMLPLWFQDPPPGTTLHGRPTMIAYDGYMPFSYGGDALPGTFTGRPGDVHVHHWSGQSVHDPNLMLGMDLDATTALANWYSTAPTSPSGPAGSPDYGRSQSQCKDFRNGAKEADLSSNNLQSLRVVDYYGEPLIVASTPGGSVVLVRPGTAPGSNLGAILWDSNSPNGHAWDDGYGAMALAVRKATGFDPMLSRMTARSATQLEWLDIFVGLTFAHRDPSGVGPGSPNPMVGAIRWLRWDGNFMQEMGPLLTLDASMDPAQRGGFCVSGLAVGDLLTGLEHPGDELVATTLAGDLFVFGLASSQIVATPKFRTWVPGALGAYNSIEIADIDADVGTPELYVAGSMGIWKWRRKP
jgi:hypothetical protein